MRLTPPIDLSFHVSDQLLDSGTSFRPSSLQLPATSSAHASNGH
eukprot:CAMPEP_0206322462 /NCGR_PEP_ID=MMETSP0106_2-20121207/19436_1 /ASSEMBLY_ACC=CAM_ASM_000206 /TAXON_ID=81532 /ORGANISM="Acanthoeca-like sp., Strain 10tr" /LENGTH=43 /DNA_ID= /DNA_START= /DNA_END= /DNA_ORIENTATION=